MIAQGSCTALVLAGSRADDPVARHAGLPHKAFVPVAGVPMLLRVVRALRQSPSIGDIAICIDRAALAADASIAQELGSPIRIVEPAASPSASVRRALEQMPEALPLLITTADHALLTAAMVEQFCAAAPDDADLVVAVASETTLRRSYPESIRTYYRFGGEGYSGCNLFLARSPAARNLAAFWSDIERHRKRPWRLIAAIGPLTLFRFLAGMLCLDAAMLRLSKLTDATVRAVELPFAEAAIDVDKPADLTLAERIIGQRGR